MEKGQSAMEFVILVGAVLFFIAAFLYTVQFNISDRTREQRNVVLNEIAFSVQDEINLATESSEGYYREFTLPNNIVGLDYVISISEGYVLISATDENYAVALPVSDVTGNIQKGMNIIRKINGEVLLN